MNPHIDLRTTLLLVVASSALLIVLGWRIRGVWLTGLIRLYGIATGVLLALAVGSYLGFDGEGPRFLLKERLRLEQQGYYVDPGSPLLIAGADPSVFPPPLPAGGSTPIEKGTAPRGFTHPVLQPGEAIRLGVVGAAGTKIERMRLTARVSSTPLRIDGICRNVPLNAWLQVGHTLRVEALVEGRHRYVSLTWKRSPHREWSQAATESFFYEQGTVEENSRRPDAPPVECWSRRIREGVSLRGLLRPTAEFLNNWKKVRGRHDRDPDATLAAWSSHLDQITLVRSRRGATDGQLGVLTAPALTEVQGLRVFIGEKRLDLHPLLIDFEVPTGKKSQASILEVGLGSVDALRLKLPKQFTERVPAQAGSDAQTQSESVIDFPLATARSWPLPPNPAERFLITSATDDLALPAYVIATGNSARAFYAIASVRVLPGSDIVEFQVSDGQSDAIRAGLNSGVRLGEPDQGVVVRLVRRDPPVPFAGCIAIGVLLVGTLLFCLGVRGADRGRLEVALALVWAGGMTLAVVRLILGYRLALLPAADGDPQLFARCLFQALVGIAATPAALLAGRLLADAPWRYRLAWWQERLRRGGPKHLSSVQQRLGFAGSTPATPAPAAQSRENGSLRVRFRLVAAVPIVWPLFAWLAGKNEAFILRISIATHLLLVATLFYFARRWVLREREIDNRAPHFAAAAVAGALGVLMFVVRDTGSLIYTLSLLPVLVGFGLWHRETRPDARGLGVALLPALLLVLLLFGVPQLLRTTGSLRFHETLNRWLPGDVELSWRPLYRITSFVGDEEKLMATPYEQVRADMTEILNNRQQTWQMLLYAREGSAQLAGLGYGRAPQFRGGMPYEVALVDCVYATQVMAEHGPRVAGLLVVLYLTLAVGCFLGAAFLPWGTRGRLFLLLATGGFFACNSLYVAAANLGMVVFTGQNLPLLGLYSGGDLLHGLVLLAAAVWSLRHDADAEGRALLREKPTLTWSMLFFLAAMIGAGAAVVRSGFDIARRSPGDHDLSPRLLDHLAQSLPDYAAGEGTRAKFRLDGTSLVPLPGARPSVLEEFYRQKFNQTGGRRSGPVNPYYLEQVGERTTPEGTGRRPSYAVRCDTTVFRLKSPFREERRWTGTVLAMGGQSAPTFSVLGRPLRLSLDKTRTGRIVALDGTNKGPECNRISVRATAEDTVDLCEFTREGDTVTLHPKQNRNPRSPDWTVRKNGVVLNGPDTPEASVLAPYDLIAIDTQQGRRIHLLYLGVQKPVLSYVQWRNGAYERIHPVASLRGLTASITAAIDRSMALGAATPPDAIQLSIDLPFHLELQSVIDQWVRENQAEAPDMRSRVALTVIDAQSGEVLALPGWSGSTSNPLPGTAPETMAFPGRSPNLQNHAAGSTFKPLLLSAAAQAFWPKYDLAQLKVRARSRKHTHLGEVAFEPAYVCRFDRPEMDMAGFLTYSYDWPACVIGGMGLVAQKRDWARMLDTRPTPTTADQLVYAGETRRWNLWRADPSPFNHNPHGLPGISATQMQRTLLFPNLREQFGALDNPSSAHRSEALLASWKQHLPELASLVEPQYRPLRNEFIDDALPDTVSFEPRQWQWIGRETRPFFVGGTDCRWNNVTMAQAAARLATGRRVETTLQPRSTPPAFPTMPLPLGSAAWRAKNIVAPMEAAGLRGTARRLAHPSLRGLRALFKTGTIEEHEANNRESEMLMFVLGQPAEGGFQPGRTFAAYLYLENVKIKAGPGSSEYRKFPLAAQILQQLAPRVRRSARTRKSR